MSPAYSSPFADLVIPDVPVHRHVLAGAGRHADRPALIDGVTGRQLTFAQLVDAVDRLAGGLRERGFGPGDVLALVAPNLPEYAVVLYAVSKAGGTVTTINPVYGVEEIAYQLRDAGASIVIAVEESVDAVTRAAEGSAVTEIVAIAPDGEGSWRGLSGPPLGEEPVLDPAEAVVVLPYSSGTTGLPKGVMLTHRNLVSNIDQFNAVARFGSGSETVIAVLPFFHIYGMQVLMNATLALGNTLVTMPRFQLPGFLALIERYRVTRAFVVPPIVLALAKDPSTAAADLSSLRTIVSGAAPLGADLTAAAQVHLAAQIVQGYGLTEASPTTHLSMDTAAAGTVGDLVPNMRMRIVDVVTREDVEPGEEGEVWFHGPNVMKGYLNNPDATAQTLDADGWLHTGDVGRVDGNGRLSITDRVKELIKYKGLQVAPAELEALLLTHPDVLDAAVIGVPDAEAGEIPKAFVVPRPGSGITAAQLVAFSRERLAHYKQVRQVEFIDQVPKSAAGKILRRELRV